MQWPIKNKKDQLESHFPAGPGAVYDYCGRAYYFYLFRETAGVFWRDMPRNCGKEWLYTWHLPHFISKMARAKCGCCITDEEGGSEDYDDIPELAP